MVWKLHQKVRKTPLASLDPTVQEVGEKARSPLDGAAGDEEPLGRVQLQFMQDGGDSVLRSCTGECADAIKSQLTTRGTAGIRKSRGSIY